MKCPFCAETIQEEARLCRFCGAIRRDGEWSPPRLPAAAPKRPPGYLTLQISGILLLLSGGYDVLYVASPVALFGAMRGGSVAVAYHLIGSSLFLGMGAGLVGRRTWTFPLLAAGTLFYTIDKLLFLVDGKAREAYLDQRLSQFRDFMEFIDRDQLEQTLVLTAASTLVCWYIFMLYVYVRRQYFLPNPRSPGEPKP